MSKPLKLNRLDLILIPFGIVTMLITVAHHYLIIPDYIYRPATYVFATVSVLYAIAAVRRLLVR